MNRLNNVKRRILVLLAVFVLAALMATPAFAQATRTTSTDTTRIGTAAVVAPKVQTLRLRVIEERTATGELRYAPADSSSAFPKPIYPMGHYTCYFEGVKIPCSFLAWLWY